MLIIKHKKIRSKKKDYYFLVEKNPQTVCDLLRCDCQALFLFN